MTTPTTAHADEKAHHRDFDDGYQWARDAAAAPAEALPSQSGVEALAEALWQADSKRAAGRVRLTAWSDESEETRDQWRFMARAAEAALANPASEPAGGGVEKRAFSPADIYQIINPHRDDKGYLPDYCISKVCREIAALSSPASSSPAEARCEYCDDTGDVHIIDGEWRGRCSCPAGATALRWSDQFKRMPTDKRVFENRAGSVDTPAEAEALPAGVEAVAFPGHGEMSFSELGRAVKAAQFGAPEPYEFDPEFYPGHQIVGTINFNSLNRIVTWFVKRALSPAPAQAGSAGDMSSHPLGSGHGPSSVEDGA